MDIDQQQPAPVQPPRRKEREERPKYSTSEDLDYRINGLEKAKEDPGMTQADIGALNRSIAKLREKKAEKAAKSEDSKREEKQF